MRNPFPWFRQACQEASNWDTFTAIFLLDRNSDTPNTRAMLIEIGARVRLIMEVPALDGWELSNVSVGTLGRITKFDAEFSLIAVQFDGDKPEVWLARRHLEFETGTDRSGSIP